MRIRVPEEPSSDTYPWDTWADMMVAMLIVPKTLDDLIDYWKSNEPMLNYAQIVKPEVYQRVKTEFTAKKLSIKRDDDQ